MKTYLFFWSCEFFPEGNTVIVIKVRGSNEQSATTVARNRLLREYAWGPHARMSDYHYIGRTSFTKNEGVYDFVGDC